MRARSLLPSWVALLAVVISGCTPVRPIVSFEAEPPSAPSSPSQQISPADDPSPVSIAGASRATITVEAGWAETPAATRVHKEPTAEAPVQSVVPAGSFVRVLQQQPEWSYAVFGGETSDNQPQVGWVSAATVGPLREQPEWARNYMPAPLLDASTSLSIPRMTLSQWSWIELTGQPRDGRWPVRYTGEGRLAQPVSGWVDASVLIPTRAPAAGDAAVKRIPVPYRSQLDGTPWEEANCGPTTVAMALGAFGVDMSSQEVRRHALNAQQIWDDEAGTFIWALATAAEWGGVRAVDLYQNGQQKRWTLSDVRRHVENGRPVILQVRYRALPGRAEKLYFGDHYIVITGLMGDQLLYNDAIDSDAPGFNRLISAAELERAMNASDRRYAYSGFALTR